MIDRYSDLQIFVPLPGKAIVPTPRVCTFSISAWANERGLRSTMERPGGAVATFVRHPLDRLVSAYHLRYADGEPYWRDELTFGEFVALLPGSTDIHVRPQSELIPNPDFVGRYETLDADWRALCAWAGLEWSPLPHIHRSKRKPWREYFTPELAARAADFYAADFERYGYDKESYAHH